VNANEFEKKLQQQSLRKIPGDWRASILQVAREGASPVQRPQPALVLVALTLWRELIQPCRYAWSGMAALWLLFWMVNSQIQPAPSANQVATSTRNGPEGIRLFEEQQRVLAELTGRGALSTAEPPQQPHPKRRSERMSEARSC
jgi:hypothetical protein